MRTLPFRVFGTLCVTALAACGGAPPARAPVATAMIPPAPPTASSPAAVDLRPVAAPPNLLASGRLAHPAKTFDGLARTARSLVAGAPAMSLASLLDIAFAAPLSSVVDVDAPADFALTIGAHSMHYAGSIALRPGTDADLAQVFSLEPAADGLVMVRPREGEHAPAFNDVTCAVTPLVAPALPKRLVCASDDASLRALAPYLTRTLARAQSTSDLHVDMNADFARVWVKDAFDRAKGRDDQKDDTQSDRAMRLWVERELAALSEDVTGLSADATLSAASAALDVELRFARAPHAFARVLAGGPSDGRAPAVASRLPFDAQIAWFSMGTDPSAARAIADAFLDYMRDASLDEGDQSAWVDAWLAAVKPVLGTGTAWSIGCGADVAAARSALAKYAAGKDSVKARAPARAAIAPWCVIGLEDPPEGWTRAMKASVEFDEKEAKNPNKKPKPPKEATTATSSRIVIGPVLAGAPPGTLHVEDRVAPKGKASEVDPHTNHVLVVPDGTRAWLVIGRDAARLARRAKDLVTPGSRALADRGDLTAWLDGPSAGGTMFTIEGLAAVFTEGASRDDLQSAASSFAALARVPRGGRTPLLVGLTRGSRGDGPSAKVRVIVPFAVVDEARRWLDRDNATSGTSGPSTSP